MKIQVMSILTNGQVNFLLIFFSNIHFIVKMSTTTNSFNCLASKCTAPHGGHFVLRRRVLEEGKTKWTVSAKTMFDISMCYARARQCHCKCLEVKTKCNWCRSIS